MADTSKLNKLKDYTTSQIAQFSTKYEKKIAQLVKEMTYLKAKDIELDKQREDLQKSNDQYSNKCCVLELRMEANEKTIEELKEAANDQARENDELRRENNDLQQKVQMAEGRLTRNEKLVEDLRNQVLDLEMRQMQFNLLFSNIAEPDGQEDVFSTIMMFLEKEMMLSLEDLGKIRIDKLHRIGKKINGKHRQIVVRFANSSSKILVLQHGKKLAGKPFSVYEQLPRPVEEKRKQLLPLYKEAKESKKKARWSGAKLIVENKVIEARKDEVKDVNVDIMGKSLEVDVKRAPPIMQNGSSFQAAKVKVECNDDIIPAIHATMKDVRVARAKHNIYAYRFKTHGNIIEHYEDDNEHGAGRRLLSLLQKEDIINTFICVSRWHFGPNLGKVRFYLICEAAGNILKM